MRTKQFTSALCMIFFLLVGTTSYAQQKSTYRSTNSSNSDRVNNHRSTTNRGDNKVNREYANYQTRTDKHQTKKATHKNKNYSNSKGHYGEINYRKARNTRARVGVRLPSLHTKFARIDVGNSVYFYYDGLFCMPDRIHHNYRVVAPPIGIIVNSIPHHAIKMRINGHSYWAAEGTIYKHIYFGNRSAFKVVGEMS